jgi:hypothetical protein
VLKGMVDKKQFSGELKVLPIDNNVVEKYAITPGTSTDSKGKE